MSLPKKGITKLIEECSELIQIACKISENPDIRHYSSSHQCTYKAWLENELADVIAICQYVTKTLDLDQDWINDRIESKRKKYDNWKNRTAPIIRENIE